MNVSTTQNILVGISCLFITSYLIKCLKRYREMTRKCLWKSEWLLLKGSNLSYHINLSSCLTLGSVESETILHYIHTHNILQGTHRCFSGTYYNRKDRKKVHYDNKKNSGHFHFPRFSFYNLQRGLEIMCCICVIRVWIGVHLITSSLTTEICPHSMHFKYKSHDENPFRNIFLSLVIYDYSLLLL